MGSRLSSDRELSQDELDAKLEELEAELLELNGNAERLTRSHAELLELQLVLETGAQFFDDAAHSASAAHSDRADEFGGERSSLCHSVAIHAHGLLPVLHAHTLC